MAVGLLHVQLLAEAFVLSLCHEQAAHCRGLFRRRARPASVENRSILDGGGSGDRQYMISVGGILKALNAGALPPGLWASVGQADGGEAAGPREDAI
jgi:hypothetical protein